MAFSFNITDFNSVIENRQGLQLSNRYAMYISPVKNLASGIYNDIPLLCEEVSLPGRSIATADYKTYGPVIKVGRESIYADLNATFILTQDMRLKEYFDEWMNKVQNDVSYDPGYYRDYVTDIFVSVLSDNKRAALGISPEKTNYTARIEDAFPTSMADVPLGHSSNNVYAKLQVTFTYRRCIHHTQS